MLVRIAVLEERIKNRDAQLVLQASEYERRLNILNHAHEQAEEKNREYVTRELFDSLVKELGVVRSALGALVSSTEFRSYKESTDRALVLREGQARGIGLTGSSVTALMGVLASIAAVIGVVILLTRHP